ncbi:MAG: hypothetical protein ABSE56_02785 [Bryobacteraceae bacterium]
MKQRRMALLSLLILEVAPLSAQRKVDMGNTYERVLAVVPMIGSGTPTDPRRPMYAPLPGAAPSGEGIIAFSFQISDDGMSALVELVARDRAGLKAILDDKDLRHDVKIFEKGKDNPADIEKEFRKHKKDFDPRHFGVRVP